MDSENDANKLQELLKKADQLRLSGDSQKAQEVLEQIIEKNPFFAPAKLALGRVFFESGRVEDARKTLEEFSEFVPDHPLANKILAKIYMHFSQHVKAKKKIDLVINANPEDTFAKRMAADIESQSDEITPDNAETKKTNYTGKTATIADIYRNQGHLQEALDIYQELLKQNAGSAEFQKKIQEIQKEMQPAPAPQPKPVAAAQPKPVAAPAMAAASTPPQPKKTRKEKLERLLYVVQQHRNHVRS